MNNGEKCKTKKKLKLPYFKNTVTFQSELFTSDKASKPSLNKTTTRTFSVGVLPTFLALLGCTVTMLSMVKNCFKKH